MGGLPLDPDNMGLILLTYSNCRTSICTDRMRLPDYSQQAGEQKVNLTKESNYGQRTWLINLLSDSNVAHRANATGGRGAVRQCGRG